MAHFETAGSCPRYSGCEFVPVSLLWGCAMFSGSCSDAVPRAGLTLRCEIASVAPGPADGIRTRGLRRPAPAPPACHKQEGREAAYNLQGVPKEVTPCRTSR